MIEWWTPAHDASLVLILASIGTMLAVRLGRFDNKESK
jgi:hypothetical protein